MGGSAPERERPQAYRPVFGDGEFRCRGAHFALDTTRGRLVYSYIRKNASSAFKVYLSRHPGPWVALRRRLVRRNPHRLADIAHLRVDRDGDLNGFDGGLFVYRDPLERMVSLYINKFVHSLAAGGAKASYRRITGKAPEEASFRDFLDYLEAPFAELDVHCYPQKAHLLDIPYRHCLPLKQLEGGMAPLIGAGEAATFFGAPKNPSDRGGREAEGFLGDIPAGELRVRRLKLKPANLLDRDARAALERRFAQDVEMVAAIETAAGAGERVGAPSVSA